MSASSNIEQYDLIVIGGGISGIGVAREAAKRGYRVVVLERNEHCQAASANSLRIIHGGFRYLQQLNLKRVVQSLRDQDLLLCEYPEFIQPLSCVMPLSAFGFKSKLPVRMALLFYNFMYRQLTGRSHVSGIYSPEQVKNALPILNESCPYGALHWTDAQIADQEKFFHRLLLELEDYGGAIQTGAEVTSIVIQSNKIEVATSAATYLAPKVVNAAGAWVARRKDWPQVLPEVDWAVGFNLVLSKKYEDRYGIGIKSKKGRLFFLTPRQEAQESAIGTWYFPLQGAPGECEIGKDRIEAALEEVREVLPAFDAQLPDVKNIEAGVLPMKNMKDGEPVLISSEQFYQRDGYLAVLSTKLTTFQSQARAVLDQLGLA